MSSDLVTSAESAKVEIGKLEHERMQVEARLNRITQRTPPLSELGSAFGVIARALAIADHKGKSEIYRSIFEGIRLKRSQSDFSVAAGGRAPKRSFRMTAQVRTARVICFGMSDLEAVMRTTSYRDINVGVTIEIHTNRKRQQVLLLEHAYSIQSASYTTTASDKRGQSGPENPIQRATRWSALLASDGITAKALASAEKVSPTLLSFHLRLLEKLPQSVIDFLRSGRDRELKKPISFRELQRLADRSPQDAVTGFHERISGRPMQDVMSLKYNSGKTSGRDDQIGN